MIYVGLEIMGSVLRLNCMTWNWKLIKTIIIVMPVTISWTKPNCKFLQMHFDEAMLTMHVVPFISGEAIVVSIAPLEK